MVGNKATKNKSSIKKRNSIIPDMQRMCSSKNWAVLFHLSHTASFSSLCFTVPCTNPELPTPHKDSFSLYFSGTDIEQRKEASQAINIRETSWLQHSKVPSFFSHQKQTRTCISLCLSLHPFSQVNRIHQSSWISTGNNDLSSGKSWH